MLGYGSLQEINHTASLLRAFENELAGAQLDESFTWNALTGAMAPGPTLSDWGGASKKATAGDSCATVMLWYITCLLLHCHAVAFTMHCLLNSAFFRFCRVADLPGQIWDSWASVLRLRRASFLCLASRLRLRRSRRRRFSLPGRFVGRRRFRLPRRRLHRVLLPRRRTLLLRFLLFLLLCLFGPISCARVIFRTVGLLATRVGEASHPGPASTAAASSTADPWATYLEEKSRQSTQRSGKPALQPVSRSKWVDCSLDLTQLDFTQFPDALNMITPANFAENSTGIVLLSRALFAGVHRVRSKHPLLVVLPGGKNDDLLQLGLSESAFSSHWMFIKDPLQPVWARKLCTLVQMGAIPVLPCKLDDAPAWDTSSHLEFHAHLSRRLFASDDAWQSYLATSRSQVPVQLRALHHSFSTANVEFYTWTKIDNHAQRVTFRAPTAQKDLLLAASGVHVPFLINLVCRDDASRASRDSASSVVWLGKMHFPEALTLIKQLDCHLGMAMSKQSFGIRCASSALDTVRRLVSPSDSKYFDSNN